MSFLTSIFSGNPVKHCLPIVKKINDLEPVMQALSDDELRGKTVEFRTRLEKGTTLDELLPEAFAVVREASRRTLGQRHYDVQLIGGITLHEGKIAEMMTGEGKTLVATLPAYLNALPGKGVHIVTVNDYLSLRDATWMGQIYSFLGLSVGVLNHNASYIYDPNHQNLDEARDELGSFKVVHEFMRPTTKQEVYRADITYGTNNEYGFDYLRDNVAYAPEDLAQREYHYAIVDEIDSILIDEARTPLIISAPSGDAENLYEIFAGIAAKLNVEEHYTVDEKLKAIQITDAGITRAEELLGIDNIYTEKGVKYVHHLETAVRAQALFHKDKEYVVRDDEVIIVDEFTGRLQAGRRWSDGLHQAVEAKEGVRIQKESRTFASITFQNYFRLYGKLAGMTGTGETSSEEFYSVYKLEVVKIPTNRPVSRIDRTDLIYQTEQGKFKAIARKVKELNQKGQPVLIGTVSIEKNELLSEYLKREGVPHEVLNAKNHEREGEIVAQAGRKGAVVIATNMAGRGVDIKLGGNPSTPEQYEEIKARGGLFVLGTERHEARRIDNQLRGRAGRQGDPGETQFFVSMEDSLMRVFASDVVKNMMGRMGIAEDEAIQNKLISRSLETAQTKIEGFHFDARKHVLSYDDVMTQQRAYVYGTRREVLLGGAQGAKAYLAEIIGDNEELKKLIEEKVSALGEEEFYQAIKRLILQVVDTMWMEHLETMDYLKSSVNLRAYGQRDPLVEYKKEGLRMFRAMKDLVREEIVRILPAIGAGAFVKEEEKAREVVKHIVEIGGGEDTASTASPIQSDKTGRNDLCTCGSGKKYKKCCGK
ncbi:MAG: preprotein translocase subunit SecA [Candidatus Yonathbacteria bacterium RIFCSPLOWO2_01_FULL_43_27]|uniref:Protein translocase subunit SecA n=1 Tax=Candidatus Yonathbacteria bacterium RIFCSPLOWO2_01_FULL_43_27 TaxID=1802726 RepID=A0A1G2SDE3_9BACT|nr:MAG: preprotein translocase subunit SecA [Candidatus Yonathbacteria bacterium RIFCSPHIGHO2_01_FULL_44_19]OHA82669.1 MAG: preprotein translocase subunit SecA [Candidatus Yonathbacteria bacterium RIFCSPLOWO2_01_FULL_43_27]